MTDIDQLTGTELRKAVARQVGWKWHDVSLWCEEHRMMAAHASDHGMVRLAVSCKWDDAMAACEAAGVRQGHVLNIYENYVHIRNIGKKEFCGMGQGTGPEAVLRALLHVLAVRTKETASDDRH